MAQTVSYSSESQACPKNPLQYLHFGQGPDGRERTDYRTIIKILSIALAIIAASSVIGLLAGGALGCGIGCAATLVGVACIGGTYALCTYMKRPTVQPPLCGTTQSPPLGKYHTANLRLAKTADDGYAWKKKLIRSAEQSIELSANFAGGHEFRKILTLMEERMKERPQFRVHLLINPEMLEKEDKRHIDRLKTTYGDRFVCCIRRPSVCLFPALHTQENHVKALIVDGKYFVVGGTSIHPQLSRQTTIGHPDVACLRSSGSKVCDRAIRDNDIVGEGEETADSLRSEFFSLFQLCEQCTTDKSASSRFFPVPGEKGRCSAFHEKEGLFENARLKLIVGGPEQGSKNSIVNQYEKRIRKAKERIVFANMQFNPHKILQTALAKKRSSSHCPDIRLITNGMKDKSCLGRCCCVLTSRANYPYVDTAYEYQVPKTQYHKKVAVFDGIHTIIGSANIGPKSSGYDYEMIFDIKDKRVAAAMQEVLQEDIKQSKKISRSEIMRNRWCTWIPSSLVSVTTQFV